MSTRHSITSLVHMMVNAVLFGAGLLTVLLTPAFAAHAFVLIPPVVVVSFVIAAPLSWVIAPWLTARHARQHPTA